MSGEEIATIITLIAFLAIITTTMAILASGKTPEAEDLQGAPETLGDFPPLPPMKLRPELENIPLEELEKILKGDQ